MKKSYIQPTTTIVYIESGVILNAVSLGMAGNASATFDSGVEGDVKGNVHHYDVWEDDWSEENDE